MPPRQGWRIFLDAVATKIPLLTELRQTPATALLSRRSEAKTDDV